MITLPENIRTRGVFCCFSTTQNEMQWRSSLQKRCWFVSQECVWRTRRVGFLQKLLNRADSSQQPLSNEIQTLSPACIFSFLLFHQLWGHKRSPTNNNSLYSTQPVVRFSHWIYFPEKIPLNISVIIQGGSNELTDPSGQMFRDILQALLSLVPTWPAAPRKAVSFLGRRQAHGQAALRLWPHALGLTIRAAPTLEDALRAGWLPFLLGVCI